MATSAVIDRVTSCCQKVAMKSGDPTALSGLIVCAQVAPAGDQAPETTAEPAAKLDPDSDEIREKFRIVRVRRLIAVVCEMQ